MREASKLIGVPESTYRDWEYGREIRGEPYLQIAKAFGITLDELFGVHSKDRTIEEEFDLAILHLQSLKDKIIK